MSSTFKVLTATYEYDELVDIKPDISVLCHDTSTTNTNSFDIKPDSSSGDAPICSNQCFGMLASVGEIKGNKEQFDRKQLRNEKLNQLPLDLVDGLDKATSK